MLRLVNRSQIPEGTVIEAHGWIAGADVPLLRRELEQFGDQVGRLVLDLEGVRFIDRDGLDLLRRWLEKQLSLRSASAFVCMLLEEGGLTCDPPSASTQD
jgi:anti-anti-sigma regulatory factor